MDIITESRIISIISYLSGIAPNTAPPYIVGPYRIYSLPQIALPDL
jgi:hypothetical protein